VSDAPTDVISTIEELDALYGGPVPSSVTKQTDHITALQRRYIEASPFALLATVGPEGADCSPRGDPPGFVRIVDERTLHMPDRRGNNRIDSLRNIVRDGRVGLLFVVPGIGVTLRVNGRAVLRTDEALRASFDMDTDRGAKRPTTVIEITVSDVYTQCPKALIRSHLWDPARFRQPGELPTVGQVMAEITAEYDEPFDGDTYDRTYPQRVRDTIY
jgi:uncharacterized protein